MPDRATLAAAESTELEFWRDLHSFSVSDDSRKYSAIWRRIGK
jgi:hypothetical protein